MPSTAQWDPDVILLFPPEKTYMVSDFYNVTSSGSDNYLVSSFIDRCHEAGELLPRDHFRVRSDAPTATVVRDGKAKPRQRRRFTIEDDAVILHHAEFCPLSPSGLQTWRRLLDSGRLPGRTVQSVYSRFKHLRSKGIETLKDLPGGESAFEVATALFRKENSKLDHDKRSDSDGEEVASLPEEDREEPQQHDRVSPRKASPLDLNALTDRSDPDHASFEASVSLPRSIKPLFDSPHHDRRRNRDWGGSVDVVRQRCESRANDASDREVISILDGEDSIPDAQPHFFPRSLSRSPRTRERPSRGSRRRHRRSREDRGTSGATSASPSRSRSRRKKSSRKRSRSRPRKADAEAAVTNRIAQRATLAEDGVWSDDTIQRWVRAVGDVYNVSKRAVLRALDATKSHRGLRFADAEREIQRREQFIPK